MPSFRHVSWYLLYLLQVFTAARFETSDFVCFFLVFFCHWLCLMVFCCWSNFISSTSFGQTSDSASQSSLFFPTVHKHEGISYACNAILSRKQSIATISSSWRLWGRMTASQSVILRLLFRLGVAVAVWEAQSRLLYLLTSSADCSLTNLGGSLDD